MAGGAARNNPGPSGEGTVLSGNAYFVDSLFRADRPSTDSKMALPYVLRPDAFNQALSHPDMPAQDKTYLAGLVSARTGLSQPDAERRVSETVVVARQDADDAHKQSRGSLIVLAFCGALNRGVLR